MSVRDRSASLRRRLVGALLLCVIAGTLGAQNPFLGGDSSAGGAPSGPAPVDEGVDRARSSAPRLRLGALPWLVEVGGELQAGVARFARRAATGDRGALIAAIAAAVAFGFVHILGPGHGKVFAIGHFSGIEARPRDGLVYSAIVSVLDSISAFIFVWIGFRAVSFAVGSRESVSRIVEVASYALIIVLVAGHALMHRFHDHGHHDGDHDDAVHSPRARRPVWLLAVSVGMVPCPLSSVLLVFGLANGMVGLMIVLVAAVSLGGFFAMSIITTAVISGRSVVIDRLSGARAERVAGALETSSSVAIVAVATVLLLAALAR